MCNAHVSVGALALALSVACICVGYRLQARERVGEYLFSGAAKRKHANGAPPRRVCRRAAGRVQEQSHFFFACVLLFSAAVLPLQPTCARIGQSLKIARFALGRLLASASHHALCAPRHTSTQRSLMCPHSTPARK